jgi:hypothetical protein
MVKSIRKRDKLATAVVANHKGEIFDLAGYAAVGMAGPPYHDGNHKYALWQ